MAKPDLPVAEPAEPGPVGLVRARWVAEAPNWNPEQGVTRPGGTLWVTQEQLDHEATQTWPRFVPWKDE